MFNIELREIHIGEAVKRRFEELELTKTEFGRRIGVPKQHVNRIFQRETMETKRLVNICQALDYNFFSLFCDYTDSGRTATAAREDSKLVNNSVGDTYLRSQIELYKERVEGLNENKDSLKDQIATLKDNIEQLKSQLHDKDELISIYRER